MTAKQFIQKYPDAEVNENCLEDIACPHCGNRDRFRVEGRTMFTMTDNGEDDHADLEYDDDCFAICEYCHEGNKYSYFRIAGLDKLLTQTKGN